MNVCALSASKDHTVHVHAYVRDTIEPYMYCSYRVLIDASVVAPSWSRVTNVKTGSPRSTSKRESTTKSIGATQYGWRENVSIGMLQTISIVSIHNHQVRSCEAHNCITGKQIRSHRHLPAHASMPECSIRPNTREQYLSRTKIDMSKYSLRIFDFLQRTKNRTEKCMVQKSSRKLKDIADPRAEANSYRMLWSLTTRPFTRSDLTSLVDKVVQKAKEQSLEWSIWGSNPGPWRY